MRQNLLQLTQSILASLGSDEVNSISDTTESSQVAEFIRQSYFNITGVNDLPEHNQLLQLLPSNDSLQPTLMYIPDGVNRVEWIKYFDSNPVDGTNVSQFGSYSHGLNTDLLDNAGLLWTTTSTTSNTIGTGTKVFTVASSSLPIITAQAVTVTSGPNQMIGTVVSYVGTTLTITVTTTVGSGTFTSWNIQSGTVSSAGPGYKDVTILSLEDFLWMTNAFMPTDTNVGSYTLTMNSNETPFPMRVTIMYKNDRQPCYCAIISNDFVLFDSYDNTQDSTLQSAKTECLGWVLPAWQMTDDFIPSLDERQFPLLLNEAKALAFKELKNTSHDMAEKEVRRQKMSLQKFKETFKLPHPFEKLPSFGRTPRTGGYGLGSRYRLH